MEERKRKKLGKSMFRSENDKKCSQLSQYLFISTFFLNKTKIDEML